MLCEADFRIAGHEVKIYVAKYSGFNGHIKLIEHAAIFFI